MKIDLKPCPFCGADPDMLELEAIRVGVSYAVECPECGAMSWPAMTRERAAKDWNRRVPPSLFG